MGSVGEWGKVESWLGVQMNVGWRDLWEVWGAGMDGFTEQVDVMPTLIDLEGLTVPEQCQGR